MLVLSRKLREDILIPALGITITPVDMRRRATGDYIRIAIDAPQDIKIYRREVWEEMQKNGEAQCD